ncbi:MAG: 1-acyl-sn-glycerol-3-phosphate acyltransferase [Anaerolineales bacterium]|nr:1-acyl-sn-glycerol-3-phosphate acyltransferase [Anaerolineales bacterium]
MSYTFIRFVIRVFFKYFTTLEINGRDKLPEAGAYIIAANHLGVLDPPLVHYFLDRRDVILTIAEKYQRNAFLRWLVRSMNAIYIDRFNADIRALRIVLDRLQQGGVLVIAPEGTRSPSNSLIEARPGGSYLAAKTGLPLFPVAVTGTEDKRVISQLRHLRRPHITIRVGNPFTFPPLERKDRQDTLQRQTDEIMCQIAIMLPPAYRGVYAEHPRLLELEQESNAANPAHSIPG